MFMCITSVPLTSFCSLFSLVPFTCALPCTQVTSDLLKLMALLRLHLVRWSILNSFPWSRLLIPPSVYDTHCLDFLPLGLHFLSLLWFVFPPTPHMLGYPWPPPSSQFCTIFTFFVIVTFFCGLLRPLSSKTSDLTGLSYASHPWCSVAPFSISLSTGSHPLSHLLYQIWETTFLIIPTHFSELLPQRSLLQPLSALIVVIAICE